MTEDEKYRIGKGFTWWPFRHNCNTFECKCGCGTNCISFDLVERVELFEKLSGSFLTISSACRCKEHNAKVGGSKTSSHLKGLALDIEVKYSTERFYILSKLMSIPYKSGLLFNRIGICRAFIHVDIDSDKDKSVIWTY